MIYGTADLGGSYPMILAKVMNQGQLVSPRGENTREVRPLVLQLDDPRYSVVSRGGFNEALMWMEIAQVVGGVYDGPLYERVSMSAAKLLTEHGAYGPRTAYQLKYVVQELFDDPDSRRAVVFIGRNTDLQAVRGDAPEMPCTLTWQFFVRNSMLEMIVNMRSLDLVWGLSYDVPMFTSVQRMVARALGLEAGTYTHIAGSAHIYERHWEGLTVEEAPGHLLPTIAVDAADPLAILSETQQGARTALLAATNSDEAYPPLWERAGKLWSGR